MLIVKTSFTQDVNRQDFLTFGEKNSYFLLIDKIDSVSDANILIMTLFVLLQLPLFRFDASIHALSTNSYIEDTRQFQVIYCQSPRYSDTLKSCCCHPKILKKRFYYRAKHPKDADSIANSEDPDQTPPLGAV